MRILSKKTNNNDIDEYINEFDAEKLENEVDKLKHYVKKLKRLKKHTKKIAHLEREKSEVIRDIKRKQKKYKQHHYK